VSLIGDAKASHGYERESKAAVVHIEDCATLRAPALKALPFDVVRELTAASPMPHIISYFALLAARSTPYALPL